MKTLLAILKKAGGWRPSLYVKIESPVIEFAVRLVHPFAGLVPVIPDVFRLSEHPGKPFRTFALVDRERTYAASGLPAVPP